MTSLAEKTARDLSKTSNIPLILINIADLQDPSIDKKLRSLLFDGLLEIEKGHYEKQKQIYDLGEFEQHFSAVVTGNSEIKQICKGIIASESQYVRQQFQVEQSTISHLMTYMSQLSRGIQINALTDSQALNNSLQHLYETSKNKKDINFVFFQHEFVIDMDDIDIDSKISDGTLKLAQMGLLIQSIDKLPVLSLNLNIKTKSIKQMEEMSSSDYKIYKTTLIKNLKDKARMILSGLVFELQNLELKLETVIICTNFAETLYLAYELKEQFIIDSDYFKLREFATGIAFYTSRLYYTTLPPAIAAIYNSISFGGKRKRISLLILNQIELEMQSLSCCATGILVQASFLEKTAVGIKYNQLQEYSIIRRIIRAQINLTDEIETLKKVSLGKYTEDNQ